MSIHYTYTLHIHLLATHTCNTRPNSDHQPPPLAVLHRQVPARRSRGPVPAPGRSAHVRCAHALQARRAPLGGYPLGGADLLRVSGMIRIICLDLVL